MVDALMKMVSAEQILNWIIIAFLIGYFLYKEWPELHRRVTTRAIREHKSVEHDRTFGERLDKIEQDIEIANEKLARDYERLNRIESQLDKQKAAQMNMSEELEIIMEALLGALGGLQELGANGHTNDAKSKIQEYLNKKAHRNDVDDF